ARCRDTLPADRIVRTLEVVSQSCIELCLGQALESALSANCSATVEQYWRMVSGKSASLFRASCESGAILGGGADAQVAALRGFGAQLGLAYQVVDDLLAYTGADRSLGKSVTSDVRNRRV